MTPVALFAEIVRRAPQFETVVQAHLRDYDELLAHVLMADLVRFVGARYLSPQNNAGVPTEGEIVEILRLLEEELAGGDPETENVIAASFVENLLGEDFLEPLLARFGPNLRREYDKMG